MKTIDYDASFSAYEATVRPYRDVVRSLISQLLLVEENGRFLSLTFIASRLGISLVTLSRCYNKVQDLSGPNFLKLARLHFSIVGTTSTPLFIF